MINPSFSTLLHRVVFDPLSYIHPQRSGIVPELIKRPAERAAVNELLIRTGRLDTHIGESYHLLQDPVVQHLLLQWDLLVQTAFLLGCSARRGELAWQGKLLCLPEWARLFLRVNLLPAAAPCRIPKSVHGGLLCTGYSLLQGSFSHFPRFLTQRISLLFPPQVESAQLSSPVDPLMLLLALQHAQRYPDKLFPSASARWCTD